MKKHKTGFVMKAPCMVLFFVQIIPKVNIYLSDSLAMWEMTIISS